MRFILAAALACISFLSHGQDLMFRLAGSEKLTWVGQSSYINSVAENTLDLTFYKNFTVVPYSNRYHKKLPTQHWSIVKGDYYDDDNIIVQVGNRQYHVEFSKTNNGADYMMMTADAIDGGGATIVNTYYARQ